jgi:uncharacterized membrane protein
MNWFFLTVLSVIVSSFAGILQKVLMKDNKSNPYSYAIVFHILLGFLNLTAALVIGFKIPSVLDSNILLLLLSAALWGGCTLFLFKTLQLLESSEVSILSSFGVVITIIASILFLNESFNFQKMFGVIIIIFSIFIVTNLKKGFQFNKGVLYALIMVIFASVAFVLDAVNVQNYDVVSYNTISNFLIGGMLLIFYPKVLLEWRNFVKPEFLKKMLPLGICATVQALAYLYALSYGGNTAQISAIKQSQVIVTVLFAIIFLGEKDNLKRKLIAAFFVTVGIILLK